MISDQVDHIFRLPTFVPRHFIVDSEQFCAIATKLLDDRLLILGALFEKFVEKEEEALRARGNGDADVDRLCKQIFDACVESNKQLTELADTLAHWNKTLRKHLKCGMRDKKKIRLQEFLVNCDGVFRVLDHRRDVFPKLPSPEAQIEFHERRRRIEAFRSKLRAEI